MRDPEFEEFIERVRRESDILAVVSDYVSLKKNGKYYWGCCPFHSEKTPSFSVTPEKGIFYCFGCHAGGNVFNFLMKADQISFFEAAKKLAEKFHIPLPQKDKTPQELAREKERARMWAVNENAGKFFYACLAKTGYGAKARAYLRGRGVSEKTIETFQIGFAPNAWDKLTTAFKKRDFSDELLLKAGLALEGKSGGIYDRFRNRVMFPIADERGRIVGFGGRVMDDSQPKYLNSSETIVFNKRNTLFALHLAYRQIRSKDCVIIVEGYMDAITAHAYGVTNVVASLGTAFTRMQCRKLLRYTRRFVFSYDSDAAGQSATLRALEIARKAGAQVKVLEIPDGKDPDEFIRKYGGDAFEKLADAAVLLVDYQVKMALTKYDNTTLEGKVGAVNALMPVLSSIENAVELNGHLQQIAQKIGIEEGAVRSELQQWRRKNKQDNYVKKGQNTFVKPLENAAVQAGRHLLCAMWKERSLVPFMSLELPAEKFASPSQREIAAYLYAHSSEAAHLTQAQVSAELQEAANAEFSLCQMLEGNDSASFLDDCMERLHKAYLNRLYEKHRLRADELERMGDEGYLHELAQTQKIQNEINRLKQKNSGQRR